MARAQEPGEYGTEQPGLDYGPFGSFQTGTPYSLCPSFVPNAGSVGPWTLSVYVNGSPIPFVIRLPFAVAFVIWGARTDRFWTVPVAGMLALPALCTAGSRCCWPSSRCAIAHGGRTLGCAPGPRHTKAPEGTGGADSSTGPLAPNKSGVLSRRRVPRPLALRPSNLVPETCLRIAPLTGLSVRTCPFGQDLM